MEEDVEKDAKNIEETIKALRTTCISKAAKKGEKGE
jgi:hypothetical protein